MLDALTNLFRNTPAAPSAEVIDERLALAALLVAAARRDDDYHEDEKRSIDSVLVREFEISPEEARALRERAEAAESDAMGLFRFTHSLKESTPFEERVGIIEHLWEVALADGVRDAAEDNLIRRVCGLLGVPDRDSGLARQRAEARSGNPSDGE